ncbi:hypothetical protein [Estrella lausannensis]|uniref:Uncharacterized protein n=1 Tax=Estrella lausannensis TaxID=483423 RepID=A0A0H5DPU7_9BACT|nr:hypothetical protein [Estrella lausannensis]CRX38601.1 conserved hypothetical protein [Estrella lausannensis]
MTAHSAQDVKDLYCLIGEAVCMIQHLEGALSHSITLKKDVRYPHSLSKDRADICLKRNQRHTLGKAIQLAHDNDLYPETFFSELRALLDERNWLIHNFVCNNLEDMHTASKRALLIRRIKEISNKAIELQMAIEYDLIGFSESVGIDMSRVRSVMEQF